MMAAVIHGKKDKDIPIDNKHIKDKPYRSNSATTRSSASSIAASNSSSSAPSIISTTTASNVATVSTSRCQSSFNVLWNPLKLDEHACCICTEVKEDMQVITTCAHNACTGCLEKLKINDKPLCPLCRTPFTEDQIKDNFGLNSLISTIKKYNEKLKSVADAMESSEDPVSARAIFNVVKAQRQQKDEEHLSEMLRLRKEHEGEKELLADRNKQLQNEKSQIEAKKLALEKLRAEIEAEQEKTAKIADEEINKLKEVVRRLKSDINTETQKTKLKAKEIEKLKGDLNTERTNAAEERTKHQEATKLKKDGHKAAVSKLNDEISKEKQKNRELEERILKLEAAALKEPIVQQGQGATNINSSNPLTFSKPGIAAATPLSATTATTVSNASQSSLNSAGNNNFIIPVSENSKADFLFKCSVRWLLNNGFAYSIHRIRYIIELLQALKEKNRDLPEWSKREHIMVITKLMDIKKIGSIKNNPAQWSITNETLQLVELIYDFMEKNQINVLSDFSNKPWGMDYEGCMTKEYKDKQDIVENLVYTAVLSLPLRDNTNTLIPLVPSYPLSETCLEFIHFVEMGMLDLRQLHSNPQAGATVIFKQLEIKKQIRGTLINYGIIDETGNLRINGINSAASSSNSPGELGNATTSTSTITGGPKPKH